VLRTGDASLCPDHPGFPEDVMLAARPADLHRLFTGRISFASAIDEGLVEVDGPPSIVRSLPAWFILRASGPDVPVARVAR
jgi:hypothetical protein